MKQAIDSRPGSRSLNSSRTNSSANLTIESHDSGSQKPLLRRHSSLADLARGYKLQNQPGLQVNDVRKIYTVARVNDDGHDEAEIVEEDISDAVLLRTAPESNDARAVNYLLPESLRARSNGGRNLPEDSNFLYRIGSQVYLNSKRNGDEEEDYVAREAIETAARNGTVLRLGEGFGFEDDECDSDSSDSSDKASVNDSKASKLWDFVLSDILGFDQVTPPSISAKRATRERKAGIFDPTLAIVISTMLF